MRKAHQLIVQIVLTQQEHDSFLVLYNSHGVFAYIVYKLVTLKLASPDLLIPMSD